MRWDTCPHHINSEGVSGQYRCIYMDADNFIETPKFRKIWGCKRSKLLPEELFEI